MLLKDEILDELTKAAKISARLRMNYNIHVSFNDAVQRMFNALEPGTEIPIARHKTCSETLILLRGKLRINIYNDNKDVIESYILDNDIGNIGYHIEKDRWHKVESLESGTVVFETREGPYVPLSNEDILK